MRNLNILKDLVLIPSPSGFEEPLAKYIYKHLKPYVKGSNMYIDSMNNLVVLIPGKTKESIMIDAHSDLCGFVVSNIEKCGLINVQHIGGGVSQTASARHINIITDKGIIPAVIDRKHAHLVNDENEEKIEKLSDAQIDIGIRGEENVSKFVKIGDPCVYTPSFSILNSSAIDGKYIAGYGFDDKSGCFILIETIKKIVSMKATPTNTLIFTFSAQEETAYTKVVPLVEKYRPSLFIEADVTFATDYSDNLEKEVGRCSLGDGIVLYRGVDVANDIVTIMSSIAKKSKSKIKIQYQASNGRIGYTATEVTHLGPRALILGIPLRNMHSVVETINTNDLEYGINLLYEFLKI